LWLQKLNFFGAPLLSPDQQARMELAELDAQVSEAEGEAVLSIVALQLLLETAAAATVQRLLSSSHSGQHAETPTRRLPLNLRHPHM
jgi:hypothetical protein